MPPCFSATFGCRICCAGVRCGATQFPDPCNVRCLRVKTQDILPRSEVTMEVSRCQCAHRCRVQVQSSTPLHRRDGDIKLVENVARSCDEVLELSGGLRWVRCRVFVNPSISANMCAKTVTASAFGWNGDGFTEQCPWLKGIVSCDRVWRGQAS